MQTKFILLQVKVSYTDYQMICIIPEFRNMIRSECKSCTMRMPHRRFYQSTVPGAIFNPLPYIETSRIRIEYFKQSLTNITLLF